MQSETLRGCITLSIDKFLFSRFLLASLQLKYILGEKDKNDMREAMKELPSTLDDAYEDIFQRIEKQTLRSVVTAKRTLSWCYYSRRPLHVDELGHALVVEYDDCDLRGEGKSVTTILDCCLSFVTHDQYTGEVRFIHPSVQRWFDNEPQNQKLLGHEYLARVCLTYLNFNVFDTIDLANLPPWYNMVYGPGDAVAKYLGSYPFYRYAVQFWSDHTREVEQAQTVQNATLLLLEADNRRTLALRIASYISRTGDVSGQTALHTAAACGLGAICQLLVNGLVRDSIR